MFTQRLKELREQKKLSQQSVATALGLSRQVYNNYELGKREPDGKTFGLIAEFFDVSVDYLLGVTNNPLPANRRGLSMDETAIKNLVNRTMAQVTTIMEEKGVTQIPGLTEDETTTLKTPDRCPTLHEMLGIFQMFSFVDMEPSKYFMELYTHVLEVENNNVDSVFCITPEIMSVVPRYNQASDSSKKIALASFASALDMAEKIDIKNRNEQEKK